MGGRRCARPGVSYKGRCPFHDERTPSFSVDPVKKTYHCFGCGRGGDAIQFVQETENLDFVQAVEWLADRYGVDLAHEESSPQEESRRAERKRLEALLEDSAGFYSRYLWEAAEAEPARAYLAERGLSEQTARDFRLGFAPSAWDRVCAAARSKGFTPAELERAGLSSRGRRGPVDRFRGRLMFPLADARGRVRGFGARQMPGGDPPKYLNSPEGALFRKSDIVYALDRARTAIAAESRAVVVEGYTDVLALHQAGVVETVASMGTALTEQQVRELARLVGSGTLYLAFDADAAGQEAAVRGMQLAQATGMEVRVVRLPDGRDPADVAIADPEAFTAALAASVGVLAFRIDRILTAPGSRDQRYRQVAAVLREAPQSVEREEQVQLVVDRLTLTDVLAAALSQPGSRSRQRRPQRARADRTAAPAVAPPVHREAVPGHVPGPARARPDFTQRPRRGTLRRCVALGGRDAHPPHAGG